MLIPPRAAIGVRSMPMLSLILSLPFDPCGEKSAGRSPRCSDSRPLGNSFPLRRSRSVRPRPREGRQYSSAPEADTSPGIVSQTKSSGVRVAEWRILLSPGRILRTLRTPGCASRLSGTGPSGSPTPTPGRRQRLQVKTHLREHANEGVKVCDVAAPLRAQSLRIVHVAQERALAGILPDDFAAPDVSLQQPAEPQAELGIPVAAVEQEELQVAHPLCTRGRATASLHDHGHELRQVHLDGVVVRQREKLADQLVAGLYKLWRRRKLVDAHGVARATGAGSILPPAGQDAVPRRRPQALLVEPRIEQGVQRHPLHEELEDAHRVAQKQILCALSSLPKQQNMTGSAPDFPELRQRWAARFEHRRLSNVHRRPHLSASRVRFRASGRPRVCPTRTVASGALAAQIEVVAVKMLVRVRGRTLRVQGRVWAVRQALRPSCAISKRMREHGARAGPPSEERGA
eukprot:scaffold7381_cov310-Pinguiococcus_pyrenoidosus.AAC.80